VAYDETILLSSAHHEQFAPTSSMPVTAGPNVGECTIMRAARGGPHPKHQYHHRHHFYSHGLTVIPRHHFRATLVSFNGTFQVTAVTPNSFSFVNAGPNESRYRAGTFFSRYWSIGAVNAVGLRPAPIAHGVPHGHPTSTIHRSPPTTPAGRWSPAPRLRALRSSAIVCELFLPLTAPLALAGC
jgi:hypothetical protein